MQAEDSSEPQESAKQQKESVLLFLNMALEAMNNEQHGDAVPYLREVLKRENHSLFRDPQRQAHFHEVLGDCLRRCDLLKEARIQLEKAIALREKAELEGLPADREMAACAREVLACLLEAEANMAEARNERLKGEGTSEMLCANWWAVRSSDTHKDFQLGADRLVQCGKDACNRKDLQACSGCHAVFYHSLEGQKHDWSDRHRKLCKAYQTEQQRKALKQV